MKSGGSYVCIQKGEGALCGQLHNHLCYLCAISKFVWCSENFTVINVQTQEGNIFLHQKQALSVKQKQDHLQLMCVCTHALQSALPPLSHCTMTEFTFLTGSKGQRHSNSARLHSDRLLFYYSSQQWTRCSLPTSPASMWKTPSSISYTNRCHT